MRQSTRVLLFVLLCAIWGSTWLVIKIGYGGLGPFTVASLRFLIAGLAFVALVPLFRAEWPRGRAQWLLAAWVGAWMFGTQYGLIYWAEQWLESGLTAVLFAVFPILSAIAAHYYVPGERVTPRRLGGTVVAFGGVATLFAGSITFDVRDVWPMLAVLAAAACGAIATVASKRHGHALHPTALNAPAMLLGSLVLAVAAFATGERLALPSDAGTWGAVLYLALAGSVVTFLVYFTLLKSWSVTTMSFLTVLTPAIALGLGFVFLQERPTLWTGVGAVLVLAGVALALTSPRPTPPPVPAADDPAPRSR